MPEFEKLLSDLDAMGDVLAKAQAVEQSEDDKRIAELAAAADPSKAKKKEGDDDGAAELFGKSFQMTDADGNTVEAWDGTTMVKALHANNKKQADALAAVRAELDEAKGVVTKMVPLLKSMNDRIVSQDTMLKALREQPGGRQGVTVDPTKPKAAPVRGEIMAKALDAMNNGRISADEACFAETAMNQGLALPPDLQRRIDAAA